MIIRWKQADPLTFVGQWQGYNLEIFYADHTWRFRCNGKIVTHKDAANTQKATWPTATAAKEAVDNVITTLIMRQLPTAPKAIQRAPVTVVPGVRTALFHRTKPGFKNVDRSANA
jgi:hypothetical protein